MDLLATTVGALNLLKAALDWQQVHVTGVWHVHLFSNNYTVVDGTVLGSMTESAFAGYAVGAPTWAVPTAPGSIPQTASATVTFTQTSGFPSTNYGIFLTDSTNAILLSAATFTAPVVLTAVQPSWATIVTVTFKPEFH